MSICHCFYLTWTLAYLSKLPSFVLSFVLCSVCGTQNGLKHGSQHLNTTLSQMIKFFSYPNPYNGLFAFSYSADGIDHVSLCRWHEEALGKTSIRNQRCPPFLAWCNCSIAGKLQNSSLWLLMDWIHKAQSSLSRCCLNELGEPWHFDFLIGLYGLACYSLFNSSPLSKLVYCAVQFCDKFVKGQQMLAPFI